MWMQHWSNSVPSTLGLNWFFLEKKQHCTANHLNKLQRMVYCQMLIVVLIQFTLDRAVLVSRDRQLLSYWVQYCQEILSHNENENNISEPISNLFFTHLLSTVCFFSTMSLLSSVLIVVPAESLAHWLDSYYNYPQEWFSTKTLYKRSNGL